MDCETSHRIRLRIYGFILNFNPKNPLIPRVQVQTKKFPKYQPQIKKT